MKYVVSIFAVVLLTVGNANASQKDCQKAVADMRGLMADLRKVESLPSFKMFGFAVGGPHNEWLKNAKALRDRFDAQKVLSFVSSDDIAVPSDVIGWGLDKMRCAAQGRCDANQVKDIQYVETNVTKMKCKSP